ncbi:hypothetical protein JZ751_002330 [Albula glossodonta]|uniref:Uncharacterized protein n=1 Tax=Albula glossodonta TaxID=121402 RepID=A0A8T2PG20_9TELE|nr:hypothetical protein JZ751_002330 [Albula glossodonta]
MSREGFPDTPHYHYPAIFHSLSGQRCCDQVLSIAIVYSLPHKVPAKRYGPEDSRFRKHLGASSAPAGSESVDALRYRRVKKAKKIATNNNNSKSKRKQGVCTSQTRQLHASQVLQPEEALYLRKKKKRSARQDPYARLSALLYRRQPREDQKAILACMDTEDLDNITLL